MREKLRLRDVIGQTMATTTLERAIKHDRISHAYLFHGPSGVGKETIARAFVHHLSCQDNFHVVESEKSIKIDTIRQIYQNCYIQHAGYAVWLIKDADTMTLQAANSFLKIVEEPPSDTIFILLTDNMSRLLPTVISRCQVLHMPRLTDEVVLTLFSQRYVVEEQDKDRLPIVIRMAGGSIGRAIELWEGPVLERREWVLQKLAKIPTMSVPEVLGLSLEWSEERETVESDLALMLNWYRDLWCVRAQMIGTLDNLDFEHDLVNLCKKYSVESIDRIMREIYEVRINLQRNVRPRFLLGHLLLQMRKGALA